MPTRAHASLQLFIGAALLMFLKRTELGEAFTEFRCIFGPVGSERIYVPDVCVVLRENLTSERYLHRAPDLAVEVLSPDQDTPHFLDKVQFYLLHGVRMVWVVDPARQTIAVLTPSEASTVLDAGDTLTGGAILPGFSLALDEIFESPVRREEPASD